MGFVERFVHATFGQRVFVLLCLGALVITGVIAYRDLPIEAFPDLTNNQVVVITEAPSLAAPEVEQRVSYPIETALMGVPSANEVRSISKFGLSIVTVVFDDAVPVYFARQLVTERIADVRGRIPQGLEPVLGPVATAFGEIYQYVVTGDGIDAMVAKTTHDWDIRTRLRSVSGVGEVNSWGGLTKQFQVVVDPPRLEKYGLALGDVLRAVADNNQSFSGGFIEHRDERYTVRGVGLIANVSDLERVVLKSHEGVPVLLRDVAGVEVGADAARRRRHAQRQGRDRRRHGDHAQGRERPRPVAARQGADDRSGRDAAARHAHRAVLRPERGDRPHHRHRPPQPARRLPAGHGGAVLLPPRRAGLADRRRGDSAVDAGGRSSACACSASRPT